MKWLTLTSTSPRNHDRILGDMVNTVNWLVLIMTPPRKGDRTIGDMVDTSEIVDTYNDTSEEG